MMVRYISFASHNSETKDKLFRNLKKFEL